MKKSFILLILFIVVLTSCSSSNEDFIFNTIQKETYISSGDFIVLNYSMGYKMMDKGSGEVFEYIRNPFLKSLEDNSIVSLCVYTDKIYYMERYGSNGSWTIKEITIDDFSTKTIYDCNLEKTTFFLGLDNVQYDTDIYLSSSINNFFVTKHYIFLKWSLDGIYQYNRYTDTGKTIIKDLGNYFCSDGSYIYYVSNDLKLKSYNVYTEEEKILIDDVAVSDILLRENGIIFFSSYSEGYNFYKFQSGNLIAYPIHVSTFSVDENSVYYIGSNNKIYKFDFESRCDELWCDISALRIAAIDDYDYIYCLRQNENMQYEDCLINKQDNELHVIK